MDDHADAPDRPLPLLAALAEQREAAARLDQIVFAIIHDRDTLRAVLRRLAVTDLPRHDVRREAREAVAASDRAEAERRARLGGAR